MITDRFCHLFLVVAAYQISANSAFAPTQPFTITKTGSPHTATPSSAWALSAIKPPTVRKIGDNINIGDVRINVSHALASFAVMSLILTGGTAAYADEYGREVDAPTLFTGENVMICKKRGPLGACLETVARTEENDNDIAKKYFRDPSDAIRRKDTAMRSESDAGNELIEKLKQQSQDNKEQNDLYVARRTFENDQSATFGPFDKQVLILNADGKTFTLLENPQAMRLKKAGFIKNREFIKQPSQEEIDAALVDSGGGIGGAIQGLLGGS